MDENDTGLKKTTIGMHNEKPDWANTVAALLSACPSVSPTALDCHVTGRKVAILGHVLKLLGTMKFTRSGELFPYVMQYMKDFMVKHTTLHRNSAMVVNPFWRS